MVVRKTISFVEDHNVITAVQSSDYGMTWDKTTRTVVYHAKQSEMIKFAAVDHEIAYRTIPLVLYCICGLVPALPAARCTGLQTCHLIGVWKAMPYSIAQLLYEGTRSLACAVRRSL